MPDISEIHKGYRQRLLTKLLVSGVIGSILLLMGTGIMGLFNGLFIAYSSDGSLTPDPAVRTTFLSSTGIMLDTVYTSMPGYFEVRLDSQRLYHHLRSGEVHVYNISTGTERLDRGIETRSGIFLIQNKIRMLYSLQFDSTKVYNWLGFNWGVGFHSLEGRRYYWNLGRRPSSHGCIRMREEDASHLFETVELGTPVFVHKGKYARVVRFLPDSVLVDSLQLSREEAAVQFEERLLDLYKGNRLSRIYPVVLLDRRLIGHSGISIGDPERVPERQRIPPLADFFQPNARIITASRDPRVKRVALDHATERTSVEQVVLP